MDFLEGLPLEAILWLYPVLLLFFWVFFKQDNMLLKQSIDNLEQAIKKLTTVLEKQEDTLDNITERIIILEMEVKMLKEVDKDA